jgi:hypothetical protein
MIYNWFNVRDAITLSFKLEGKNSYIENKKIDNLSNKL